MKEKFYKRTWFMWLMFIIFPPAGIALMWAFKKNYSALKKGILSFIFAVWTIFLLIPTSGSDNNDLSTADSGPVLASEAAAAVEEETATQTPVKTETTATPEPTVETPTPTPEAPKDMEVHFLDVGQGLSIFVKSGDQTMIYDGGDRGASSFTVSYLKSQGVTTVNYMISSHFDEDHLAGLVGCLNAFDVQNIICSNYKHDTDIYDSFISTANNLGIELQHPSVGTEFNFGTGKFTILAPQTISSESNNNSVVIKLENGNNSFIFTGDAAAGSEAEMCSSGINLETDVLSISHHGSASATSWDFLQATLPEYAVISCGTGNSYGHPDQDTMDKLSDMEIQVFRNDKQGAVIAKSDGNIITWSQDPCNDYSPGSFEDAGTQPAITEAPADAVTPDISTSSRIVWKSATGKKYHSIPDCGRMNPDKSTQITESEAQAMGLEPCEKCF